MVRSRPIWASTALKFPTAATGIDVNLGTEYRAGEATSSIQTTSSPTATRRAATVRPRPSTAASTSTKYFIETRIPIADDMPGIYHLSALKAATAIPTTPRASTPTRSSSASEWAPIQDLKLRGSYNRAVRAPSIGDLFAPAVVGAGGTADPVLGRWSGPCHAGAVRQHRREAEPVRATSWPTRRRRSTPRSGGNAEPEARNGRHLHGRLRSAAAGDSGPRRRRLDYYDIKIDNTIASLTSNTVINELRQHGRPGAVRPDPSRPDTGSLWFNNNHFVDTNEQNIGTITTKGIRPGRALFVERGRCRQAGLHPVGYLHDRLGARSRCPTGGSLIARATVRIHL